MNKDYVLVSTCNVQKKK